jgi:hypothetical protein
MQEARYIRIYNDELGESHFDDLVVDLPPVDFAPPAPPAALHAVVSGKGLRFSWSAGEVGRRGAACKSEAAAILRPGGRIRSWGE